MRTSKDVTRQKLLAAGRDLIIERGLRDTIDIKLTEVLTRARMTTGAAYNIWPTQDDYRRSLALYVAETMEWADDRLIGAAGDKLRADIPLDQWITLACDFYFAAFVSRWDYYTLLQFWGIKEPGEELVAAINRGYEVVHDRFRLLFQRALDVHGLEVIEPLTLDDLCVMATATCEGLALRHRFQPDRLETGSGHLFGVMTNRLVSGCLRSRSPSSAGR